MKIAVISDIHGNYQALQATLDHVDRWRPDLVVVNGDVVNRGPRSLDCWALLSERQGAEGWLIVGGNHEEYVGKWLEEPADEDDPRFPIYRSSYITFQQLGERANEIIELPNQLELIGPEASTVRLTHGTMLGKDDGIAPDAPEAVLKRQISPAPDLFCTGHTHRPFVRQVNGTMVVNSGSAGTTFDGDPRISYAQLSWQQGSWQAEIVRLDYDRAQAQREFEESEFRQNGGPLVEIFLQEWLFARPMVNRWTERYEPLVVAGKIDLEKSVREFLDRELS